MLCGVSSVSAQNPGADMSVREPQTDAAKSSLLKVFLAVWLVISRLQIVNRLVLPPGKALYRYRSLEILSMPTTGIAPVSRRLQRHVLTIITTLAWRVDLDSNEDDQLWRLSGYRYLIDAWSTRADLHGCVAGLQSAGLLSCLRVHGAVSRNRTRNRSLTRRLLYQLSYNGKFGGSRNRTYIEPVKSRIHNHSAIPPIHQLNSPPPGLEPGTFRFVAGCSIR